MPDDSVNNSCLFRNIRGLNRYPVRKPPARNPALLRRAVDLRFVQKVLGAVELFDRELVDLVHALGLAEIARHRGARVGEGIFEGSRLDRVVLVGELAAAEAELVARGA